MKDIVARHKDIQSLWNQTQGYLKELETETHMLFIPAVNELRYAARKLLDVWILTNGLILNGRISAKNKKDALKTLTNAEYCLINAHHDITDEILRDLRVRMDRWSNEYGDGVFSGVTVKRAEFQKLMKKVKSITVDSRENRTLRIESYKELREVHTPALLVMYNDLYDSMVENSASVIQREEFIEKLNQTVEKNTGQLTEMERKLDGVRKRGKWAIGIAIGCFLFASYAFLKGFVG